MAKKGGVQQLQTEVNTNEDFEKFMERDGLLVMDVYTEWCGQCIGMVGCLKKIKLELGGDNLHLAICKSDNIDYLARFRNKSEPTWLIGSHGKIVNSMFGTNVPRLVQLITEELILEEKYRKGEETRKFYELTELTEIEQVIEDARRTNEEEKTKIEETAALKARNARITYVTDLIAERMPDVGVTLLFPNYARQRDAHKPLMDPADKMGLTLKDKRFVQMKEADFDFLNFECDNPIHPEVLKKLVITDCYGIMWKTSETEVRPAVDVVADFVQRLTMSQPILDESGSSPDPEARLPAVLKPYQFEISNPDPTSLPNQETEDGLSEVKQEEIDGEKDGGTIDQSVETEDTGKTDVAAGPPHDEPSTDNENLEESKDEDGNQDECKEEGSKDEKPDPDEGISSNRISSVAGTAVSDISGIRITVVDGKYIAYANSLWSAQNKRANAALIYLYFRNLTDHFLPPDPVPEPPHLAFVYDAIKRREIFEAVDQHKEAVLAVGYFTHQDPNKSELIAKTTDLYFKKRKPLIEDKLVLKVAKTPNNEILTFVALGPCYVSLNTVEGEKECEIFFPKGYNVVEKEDDPADADSAGGKKKRRRKKKKDSDASAVAATEQINEEEPIGDEGDEDETSEHASDLGVTQKPTE